MKIYLDFSVFTPLVSVGNVHGEFDLDVVPSEGEVLSFLSPKKKTTVDLVSGFKYELKVEHVSEVPTEPSRVLLSLEDVTLTTTQDAKKVMAYFEQGFGLHADVNPEWA